MGGQDWDGPHLVVGRLVLGHTARNGRGGWGRQVIIKTASAMRQPVDRVRPHPDLNGKCLTSVAPFTRLGQTGGLHRRDDEGDPTEPSNQLNRCLTA